MITNNTFYPFLVSKFDGKQLPLEIPDGWRKLFFQLCDKLVPLLESTGELETFQFIQVKEKFNYLRCYYAGTNSQEVKALISKYEKMAHYVCVECGQPATHETLNYFASYCTDCWKDSHRHEQTEVINFHTTYKYLVFHNRQPIALEDSFEEEWEEYIK